ncbi:MAG: HAD-IIA family hydrolase [Epsilonproteobacteria bacterium]|nr:HAD-IIA family hydrolase [Campylobacterota bacterium]
MSYFIDVQGTLINDIDKQPIIGSIEFINNLNKSKIPYMVVTNNTKIISKDFHKFLVNLGFDIPFENYLDPFMVLNKSVKTKEVKAFGAEEFSNSLNQMGYNVNCEHPKIMLIASKKDFSSNDYASMIETALGDVDIVGMHATSVYAKDGRRYPGVGAILEMISYATSKNYTIIGKPSNAFYEEAKRLLNLQQNSNFSFKDITMISDDAIGDLCGVKKLGAKTILVLSGKCKDKKEIYPIKEMIDKIVPNISFIPTKRTVE